MTALVWDKIGEHFYETGVDRGVLYPQVDGKYPLGVAWNGLTGVTESPSGADATDMYADNQKYLSLRAAETFGATTEQAAQIEANRNAINDRYTKAEVDERISNISIESGNIKMSIMFIVFILTQKGMQTKKFVTGF